MGQRTSHDDVIKWKHFSRYWPFVRGIHRSPVNSPHKGQWRGALMFSLICVWINGGVNNHEDGDLRRHRGHHDVNVMSHIVFVINTLPWVRTIWLMWIGFALSHYRNADFLSTELFGTTFNQHSHFRPRKFNRECRTKENDGHFV